MSTQSLPQHNSKGNTRIPSTPPHTVDGKTLLEVFLRLTEPKPEPKPEPSKGGAK